MTYLTYWRLTIGVRLRETDLPLPSVAQRCGYSSLPVCLPCARSARVSP
jgi:hypothetical protein